MVKSKTTNKDQFWSILKKVGKELRLRDQKILMKEEY